jgi:sugar lactone lactonase YvrE
MRAQQVTAPLVHHGEGPVWSRRWGGLRWVDMLAGDVMSLRDDGEVERRHVSDVVAVLRPRSSGGAVLGIERGFALEDADGTITRLGELWEDAGVRMNEGACDPDGRFYCGSMATDRRAGGGSVYRLDPGGEVSVVLPEVTISNGLAWSPDGALAYYVDTETYRVDLLDYDPVDGLSGRRPFVEVTPAHGRPDGLTVDAEGGVWVALNGGGAVHRYDPSGVLDEVVEVPARKVTACTFGGGSLESLFITTSREHLAAGEDPLAGSLFQADTGVTGLPVHEFAG